MGFLDAAVSGAKKGSAPPSSFGGAVQQGASQAASEPPHSFGGAVSQGASQGASQAQGGDAANAAAVSARDAAIKQSQNYAKAVASVFAAQSHAQKLAIIGGLLRQSAHADPWTVKALQSVTGNLGGALGLGRGHNDVWGAVGQGAGLTATTANLLGLAPSPGQSKAFSGAPLIPLGGKGAPPFTGSAYSPTNLARGQATTAPGVPRQGSGKVDVTGLLKGIASVPGLLNYAPGSKNPIANYRTFGTQPQTSPQLPPALDQGLGGLLKAVNEFRSTTTPPGARKQEAGTAAISGVNAGQFGLNAGKDFVELPATAFSSAYILGKDLLEGNTSQAWKDTGGQFVRAVEHPGQTLMQDPLNTVLMFSGLLHGAARLGAAPIRAFAPADSALGRAVSTYREPITVSGNLKVHRPRFSKSPTIKLGQVARDAATTQRMPDNTLAFRSENQRIGAIKQAVADHFDVGERTRRAEQDLAKRDYRRLVTPGDNSFARMAARAVHSAKRTFAYGPKPVVVPGLESLIGLIANGTLRHPDTFDADLNKVINETSATRPDLLDDKKALKFQDSQVQSWKRALGSKSIHEHIPDLFNIAHQMAEWRNQVQWELHGRGYWHPDITREHLERATYSHIVDRHMPGARFDENLQTMVRDVPRRTLQGREQSKAVPIPTAEMRRFASRETGGRPLMYTSDKVYVDEERGARAARAAHYVSQERRPYAQSKRNTLYAYRHGLAHTGWQALHEDYIKHLGIARAMKEQNRRLQDLVIEPSGGFHHDYSVAERNVPEGHSVINIAQPFHPPRSLEQQIKGLAPAAAEEEAHRLSLNFEPRLAEAPGGRYGYIDKHVLKAMTKLQKEISPADWLRALRGINNQFRTVALAGSTKHPLGILQENLLRDVANGVGIRSLLAGHNILRATAAVDPELAKKLRIHVGGGQIAGQTEALRTFSVGDHFEGSRLHAPLKAFEGLMKSPGPRQIHVAWNAWAKFGLREIKRVLEEEHQIAGLGKVALREHGYAEAAKAQGAYGVIQRMFGLYGTMLDRTVKGLSTEDGMRQMRAEVENLYGKWNGLRPGMRAALMLSPFGLWWLNSMRFLLRSPIDRPVLTSLMAATVRGTRQERQQYGLDLFAPNALPLYEQGGIPLGSTILAQNYYSPFGVANDPLGTASSLVAPWAMPLIQGSAGLNYLWRGINSPKNPRGDKAAKWQARVQYMFDSLLASFVPLYSKASEVLAQGAKTYNVNDAGVVPAALTSLAGGEGLPLQKGEKKQGIDQGLVKSFRPWRVTATPKGSKTKVPATSGSGRFQYGGGGGGSSSNPGGSRFVYPSTTSGETTGH